MCEKSNGGEEVGYTGTQFDQYDSRIDLSDAGKVKMQQPTLYFSTTLTPIHSPHAIAGRSM